MPGGDDLPADFQNRLFAVPQEEKIEKVGQGFRVQRTGASPDDQGISFSPLSRAQRDAGQVQDIEDPGVIEFILEGKTKDVELSQGTGRFQGAEGEALLPEELFHVRPGGKSTFAGHRGVFVQEVIENLNPKVGHPHLVYVRKGKGKLQFYPVWVFDHRVQLSADVSGRPGNFEQIFWFHDAILTFD
jgi:hypothetical protein